jgi:Bacterial Ig-like domain
MIIVSLLFIANLYPGKVLPSISGQPTDTTEDATSALSTVTSALNNTASELKNATSELINTVKAIQNISSSSDARQVPNNATVVNATALVDKIFGTFIPHLFILVIFTIIFVPLVLDLHLAYKRKPSVSIDKENNKVEGIPGLYRSLMTFGLIVLVGTVIFYLLALITLNMHTPSNPILQSLIDILKSLGTILGTGLTTIIAFYFGMRGAESAAEKATAAAASAAATQQGDVEGPPRVVTTKPGDGAPDVLPLDSLVTATFSEPMSSTTINKNTFTVKIVKIAEPPTPVLGNVSLGSDGKTAIFDSKEDFLSNTQYVVTITTGVKDLAGNALVEAKQWSFTTGTKPPGGEPPPPGGEPPPPGGGGPPPPASVEKTPPASVEKTPPASVEKTPPASVEKIPPKKP